MSEPVDAPIPSTATGETASARQPKPSLSSRLASSPLTRGTALPAIASLVAIAVFFQLQSQYFLSAANLTNLAVQVTLVAFIALGEIVVLLLGEIDLSLGSIAGATAAILGVAMSQMGLPWYVAVPIMLLCGALMGGFQGAWISRLGIPSFVVTLAGMLMFLGLQLWVLGPQGTMSVFDPTIAALTGTSLPAAAGWSLAIVVAVGVAGSILVRARDGLPLSVVSKRIAIAVLIVGAVALFNASRGVPTPFLILILVLLVAWWITTQTRPGRHLFAVGGNAEAARRAGVSVRKIRFAAFTMSGTIAAFGGLMAVSYNGSAGTLLGGGTLLLEAIGAAVIGGTSLFGGRGTVWAALFGALIMGGVSNGLDLTNAEQPVKYMVQGVIVLLAVSLDTILRRRQSRGRQPGARA